MAQSTLSLSLSSVVSSIEISLRRIGREMGEDEIAVAAAVIYSTRRMLLFVCLRQGFGRETFLSHAVECECDPGDPILVAIFGS